MKMKKVYFVRFGEHYGQVIETKSFIKAFIISIIMKEPMHSYIPLPKKEDACKWFKKGWTQDYDPLLCKGCPLYERCGDRACGY